MSWKKHHKGSWKLVEDHLRCSVRTLTAVLSVYFLLTSAPNGPFIFGEKGAVKQMLAVKVVVVIKPS